MMKFYVFLFLCLCSQVTISNAQSNTLQLLQRAETDTAKVRLLCVASFEKLNTNIDSAMYFAQEALRLAQNDDNQAGIAKSLNAIGNVLLQTGQHDKALETYLSALKKAEAAKSQASIAQTYSNIGNLYINQGEYRLPLAYLFKAKKINETSKDYEKLTINLVNIGICYQYLDMADSALFYLNDALKLATEQHNEQVECSILYYIGTVYEDIKNSLMAKNYYSLSLTIAHKTSNQNMLSSVYKKLGGMMKNENPDSALFYTSKAYEIASNNKYYVMSMNASANLYELYMNAGNKDSSLKYLKIRYDLKDSLFNNEKIKHIQTMTLQEQLRQNDLQQALEKQQKERMQNAQYIGIALFILGLFVLLIVLSHKKVKPSIIEYVGMIALLLFFEFIALYLHPYIEKWSHHKPVIALFILVCIASILVPSHHRLEKWVKEKLAKKK